MIAWSHTSIVAIVRWRRPGNQGTYHVSHRTILDWVQAFGSQLAAEVRRHRRPVGKRWFVDEVFLFRWFRLRSRLYHDLPLPTTRVQCDPPHKGNLFEFLYRRRAIQRV